MPFGTGKDLLWLEQEISDRVNSAPPSTLVSFHGSVEQVNNLMASSKFSENTRVSPFNMFVKSLA